MGLTLKIENVTSLPDGGPLSVSVEGRRGLDIGRDPYLDWTLPDPGRFISGKHCEVRWHDGGYWLHDVSTNGTYLDGADSRLKEPHRLRHGERFAIGHYIIAASVVDEEAASRDAATAAGAPYDRLWDAPADAAAPIDPRELKPARSSRPVRPDFMDWAVAVPDPGSEPADWAAPAAPPPAVTRPRAADGPAAPPPTRPPQSPPPPSPPPSHPKSPGEPMDDGEAEGEAWAQGPQRPQPAAPEPAPLPQPRRQVWVSSAPSGPWAQPASAPSAAETAPAESPPGQQPQGQQPPPGQQPPQGQPPQGPPASAAPPAESGAAGAAAAADFVALFARAAGLPPDALKGRDPAELATELGELMRLVADNMKLLLEARSATKRLSRSSNQTVVQAIDNNPLKFAPGADEALRIMFGPPTRSYLDARRALAEGFGDLKRHQVNTFSAMQEALRLTLGEFDPNVIEDTAGPDRGLAALLGSRRARLWDIYLARWRTRTDNHADGLLKAFMDYFADCYDRGDR